MLVTIDDTIWSKDQKRFHRSMPEMRGKQEVVW